MKFHPILYTGLIEFDFQKTAKTSRSISPLRRNWEGARRAGQKPTPPLRGSCHFVCARVPVLEVPGTHDTPMLGTPGPWAMDGRPAAPKTRENVASHLEFQGGKFTCVYE